MQAAQGEAVVDDGRGSAPDGDDEFPFRRPLDLWRQVVAVQPDAVAACDCAAGQQLTFAEVDALSDALAQRIARRLAALGAGKQSPLAVLLDHNRRFAVAAVAVFKCGWPEVVLDPSVPLERLRTVMAASGARLIITSPELAELAAQAGADEVLLMDGAMDDPEPAAAVPFPAASALTAGPDDISGITYTSGSTGVPKGVAVSYRTLSHQLHHRHRDDWLRPDDRVGMVMPLSFGAARGDLNSTLQTGASLHFYDPRARGAGPLPGWLETHAITLLPAPPSLLTAVVRTLRPGQQLPDSLRMVRSGGEKLLSSDAYAIRRALPATCRLLNVFGSTETTMVSAFEITDQVPDAPRPVPAGRPIVGVDVAFERDDGSSPAPGEVANLLVISRFLPVGYWRDPERTRQKYTPLGDGRVAVATGDLAVALPDGNFRLAGRKDLSVKIRGNLVEPAEVEGALLHCEGIADAIVVGRATASGRERLVAYVVLEPAAPIVRAAELRRGLRKTLPAYMIPEAIVFLSELPRNERSKVDRAQLPDPPKRAVADEVAPRSEWERQVAVIWAEVLGLASIGIEDDFFDLGGDSLSAEELVARLANRHGVEVSSRLLLEAPTVAEFAAAARPSQRESEAARRDPLVPLRREGSRPPLFCVTGAGRLGMTFRPLAAHLGNDQPVWALQGSGREIRKFPEWSVRRTARANIAAIRAVRPSGPYYLAGHSFGAVVAFEMAQQLRAAGEQVELLVVLDSFAPHPSAQPRIRRRGLREWVPVVRRYLSIGTGRALKTPGERPEGGLFLRQSRVVSMLYRGRAYPGPTVVVVAADDPANVADPVLREGAWEAYLSGPHHTRHVSGTHKTMLNEPHAGPLAALIRSEMDLVMEQADR